MRILLVGGGGREHALGWQFRKHGHELIAAPGNPGLAELGDCLDISTSDKAAIVSVAIERRVDLVVVGPEAPLVEGLADDLRAVGIDVFGPGADGARLEGSKSFSKLFFQRHQIRSAAHAICASDDDVNRAIAEFGPRVVVKVDGLAAGKGVIVCDNPAEALAAAAELRERFRAASDNLVVEQRLSGRELSVMALCDGKRVEILAQAEDHKQLGDGDVGPNTGGMGTVSPADWASDDLLARIAEEIFAPTVAGLQQDGIDFRGVLYAGLMVDENGAPWILEYNCRFGDPETQPLMIRLESDLAVALRAAARGDLGDIALRWSADVAVCVVIASAGYPVSSTKGVAIELGDKSDTTSDAESVVVFHAGTKLDGETLVTAGGRVLGVTARGPDLGSARARAYAATHAAAFEGAQFRTDIGVRKAT